MPPTLSEEEFKEVIAPVPENDYFCFVPADKSLGSFSFTRAYINFKNVDEIYEFKDKFDSYVFVDQKGKWSCNFSTILMCWFKFDILSLEYCLINFEI